MASESILRHKMTSPYQYMGKLVMIEGILYAVTLVYDDGVTIELQDTYVGTFMDVSLDYLESYFDE